MIANGGELDGKRILSTKTVAYMLSNHTVGTGGSPTASTGPGYGFGLGFAVRLQDGFAVAPGSTGTPWAGAWGTSFTVDPKEQLVAVFMAQGPSNRVTPHAVQEPDLRRDDRVAIDRGGRGSGLVSLAPRLPRRCSPAPRRP